MSRGLAHIIRSPWTLRVSCDLVIWASPLDVIQYTKSSYFYNNVYVLYILIRFEVDKDSGRVTVSGKLDREKVDLYVVSAEARDGGGSTTYTNLYINILDENDNSPVFRREDYFANVKEDSLTFLREPVAVEVLYSGDKNSTRPLVITSEI